jgi:XRE family transcriptional regulator, fatty acid utilization regulator
LALTSEHIRLLFGLKIRQLRLENHLSVSELAQRAGLAVSYISEIEKGRKYPKADKISALAQALGADYDTLVSLKVGKRLEPLADLLRSKFLTEVPLDLFGIAPADLLELLAEAPVKVSAMIRTVIDIALRYNMSVEGLYLTLLRSYQELQDNYFPDIEAEADRFLAEHSPAPPPDAPDTEAAPVTAALLTALLGDRYRVRNQTFDPGQRPELAGLRSLYRADSRTLWINRTLSAEQHLFVLARELGFQYLGLTVRPDTYAHLDPESFEQVLNNYRASYFAGCILIRRATLVARLTEFLARPVWRNDSFLALIDSFGATPERFFYRLSNVLPQDFGIGQLFFYRFNHTPGEDTFALTKQMHLSTSKQGPRGIVDEHFCRRWVALTGLQELAVRQQTDPQTTLCRTQLSTYHDTGDQFFIISVAHPHGPAGGQNMSLSMCFRVDAALRARFRFLHPPAPVNSTNPPPADPIPARTVNEACERCGLFDCRERVAAPTVLQQRRRADALRQAIGQLGGG